MNTIAWGMRRVKAKSHKLSESSKWLILILAASMAACGGTTQEQGREPGETSALRQTTHDNASSSGDGLSDAEIAEACRSGN
jgi:hypothetical protein